MVFSSEIEGLGNVESYPKSLDVQCRDGSAKLYDECGSQVEILKMAVGKAAETDKTVLVVYGAEWCVWCFVFDDYIKGKYRASYYEWEHDEKLEKWVMNEKPNDGAQHSAEHLKRFVAENFVIAHIEGDHSSDGAEAINALGVDESKIDFYPFIVSLSKTGSYASHMFGYEVMGDLKKRKDRRGQPLKHFDREKLVQGLSVLRRVAQDQ